MSEEKKPRRRVVPSPPPMPPTPTPRAPRKKSPPSTIEIRPPLADGLPETLVGPPVGMLSVNRFRPLHIQYYPLGQPYWSEPFDGWIVRAHKEPNLPVNSQSSTCLSHFAGMIQWPHEFYLTLRSIEHGAPPWFNMDTLKPRLIDKEEAKIIFAPDVDGLDDLEIKFADRRVKAMRWVSSSCIKWLILNVVNARPPCKPLQPMVSEEDYDRLKAVIAQNYQCQFREFSLMPRQGKKANEKRRTPETFGWEKILGLYKETEVDGRIKIEGKGASLDKIYAAYNAKKQEFDFRNFPEDKVAYAQEMSAQVENALINALAYRFFTSQPGSKRPIMNEKHPLTTDLLKSIFKIVNQLIYDKALKQLDSEKRRAHAKGVPMQPWDEKLVRRRAFEIRQQMYALMNVPPDQYQENGVVEKALMGIWKSTW